jgi:hypothetical protein
MYYLMPSVLDAKIVGVDGLKAGGQAWQKKINYRLSNE